MAFTDQSINAGSFVPTSYNWDVTQLMSVDVTSPQFKELIVRLYQNIGNIATALNTKESALYTTNQFQTSQLWFNPNSTNLADRRGAFREVVNIGALGAGITNTAHNLPITNQWKFTYIGGVASDTVGLSYLPLPFVGMAGNNIQLNVSATNVVLNNNTGIIFTDAYIVLEFLKS
jgi:predicted transport protein